MDEDLKKEPESATTTTTPDLQSELMEVKRQLERERESKERILAESKEYKGKWQDYRDQMSAEETRQLESDKNWKALLEKERASNAEKERMMRDRDKTILRKELNYQVSRAASDANDVADIISALPTDLIEINEADGTINGVNEAVSKLRIDKPYLFKKANAPETINTRPGMPANAPSRTLENFNMDEKMDALKGALIDSYTNT